MSMSEKSLPKPPKIVLEDNVSVPLDESIQSSLREVREIPVSMIEPSPLLLLFGLLGYGVTIFGVFSVWDNDITSCFNILCCGSFFSTISLLIYYNNYGYWEKSMGQSSANADMTTILLGVMAVVILVFYLFLRGF